MSYWDAVAIKWKAFCPCFLALLIASGQKGESSKGQLGPWSQKIWAGHGSQDEWVKQPALHFFRVSVSPI